MDRLEAIKELERHKQEVQCDHGWNTSVLEALTMAISDMRKMSYLTNRPCDVCKFNESDNGCQKRTCVFEDDGKENVNEMQGL